MALIALRAKMEYKAYSNGLVLGPVNNTLTPMARGVSPHHLE